MRASPALILFAASLGCTDSGLYATDGEGPSGPDRAEISGSACVPAAVGEQFPVKVLFAVEGGVGVDSQTVTYIADAINDVLTLRSAPYITWGFIAFHSVASGLQAKFVDAPLLNMSIGQYRALNEGGPISLRSPLRLANSILSGDMQTGCRGQIARARYVVVLIMTGADDSCNNPIYNANISATCAAYNNARDCTACELGRVTEELKGLATKYHAGEVVVQPIYVRQVPVDLAAYQAQAIAKAGGTDVKQVDPGGLSAMLKGLDLGSLQRSLKIKRLIAFNRNAIARNGVTYVDSDGDGLADVDEDILLVNPPPMLDGGPTLTGDPKINPDFDGDGLMDGIEVKMGLNPMVFNSINGCNAAFDTDHDGLSDCEERVLGTDGCITDTDGDGLPDLVEALGNTNPLIPEDLDDDDRDGLSNISEAILHSDPRSADLGFQTEYGYGYAIKDAKPTDDGRACYDLSAYNIKLVETLKRPNAPFPDIPKGSNDIYVYFQVGRDNDPRGSGIGSLFVQRIQFTAPNKKKPKGTIIVTPDDFVTGF